MEWDEIIEEITDKETAKLIAGAIAGMAGIYVLAILCLCF